MYARQDERRGRALAKLRQDRPMTQEALAVAAGVSLQTVKRAEAGRPVSAETVLALCSALGTTPEALARAEAATGTDTPPAACDARLATREPGGSALGRMRTFAAAHAGAVSCAGVALALQAMAFTPWLSPPTSSASSKPMRSAWPRWP